MWEKKWICRNVDAVAAQCLVQSGVPELAAKVLSARKMRTMEQVSAAFGDSTDRLPDPFLLCGMDTAVSRLRKAIQCGEKIAVYGDYDVDGIVAVTLMVEWLRDKGTDCVYYIPTRLEDGYGVTRCAIDELAQSGVTLIITVDTGITAAAEAQYARTKGVDMIITDHHECTGRVPDAAIVINPWCTDCRYPFKPLAGVGVAFMLVLCYDGVAAIDELMARHGDLVAIGTIADVVPMLGSNRVLVSGGLRCVEQCHRAGLRALLKESVQEGRRITELAVGFSLAPRINAAGRMGSAGEAVELLLTDDAAYAEQGAKRLCELNRKRQKVENEVQEEINRLVETQIAEMEGDHLPGALVLSSGTWHQGVVGIVASRLSERYACPVFLICVENGVGKGSARSFFGVNIMHIMSSASYLLDSWGGHEFAAGFTIKEENIPMFRELLHELSHTLSPAHVHIDAELSAHELEPQLIEGLKMLEPYGPGNDQPLFMLREVTITDMVEIGAGKGARLTIVKNGKRFSALYYGRDYARADICDGDRGDVLAHAECELRGGRQEVILLLCDMRMPRESEKRLRRELELADRFEHGEEVSPREAAVLQPHKQDFVAILRHLRRNGNEQGIFTARIGSMCRRICREEHLTSGYAKILVCLMALAETERLTYTIKGDAVSIRLRGDGPINLNNSAVLHRLTEIIGEEAY